MFIHCHISHHTTNNNVKVNGSGGLMGDHRCLGGSSRRTRCAADCLSCGLLLGSCGEASVPDPQVFATLTTAPVAASTSTTAVSNSIGGCPGNRPFKTTRQTG